jgi:hypothetical protein
MLQSPALAGVVQIQVPEAFMIRVQHILQSACITFGLAGILWGASSRSEDTNTVTARKLSIVDEAGVERIVLECPKSGLAELRFTDPQGQDRIRLGVATSDESDGVFPVRLVQRMSLEFLDSTGERIANLYAVEGGHHGGGHGIEFQYGPHERSIALTSSETLTGSPHLTLYRDNSPAMLLSTGNWAASPGIVMYADGKDILGNALGEGVLFLGFDYVPAESGDPAAAVHLEFEGGGVRLDVDKEGRGRVLTRQRGGEGFEELGE